MDLFWNAGEGETIGGVDLLGLRQVDQDLEGAWVAGVTTVSIRARYLSLLVWVFAEYYERQLASGRGSSVFDWSAFKAIVGRLEFITLAATVLSPTPDTSGALGKRNLSPQIDLLRSGKSVALDMEALALHGTYLGPCRAVGLLQDAPSAQRPIQVPPAGQALHRARSAAARGARLVDRVFTGGSLHRDDFVAEGHLFDLNGLMTDASAGERASLTAAFRRSPDFRETMAWIFRSVADAPRSPWELVKENYDACTAAASAARADRAGVRRARAPAARALRPRGAPRRGEARPCPRSRWPTSPTIVRQWENVRLSQPDSSLAQVVGCDAWSFAEPLATFVADAGPGSFEKAWIEPSACWEVTPGQQALYALALLVACERQSRGLRAAGLIPDRRGAMEQVFARLDEGAGRPLRRCSTGSCASRSWAGTSR
jgi:hypothetical protein